MTDKELIQLSNETGIPVWRFKQVLNLPLPQNTANTVEEAEQEFIDSGFDGEKEIALIYRRIELCANVEEAESVFRDCHNGTYEQSNWLAPAVLLKWFELCTTPEQVLEALDRIVTDEYYGTIVVGHMRLVELCESVDDVKEALIRTTPGSSAEVAAIKKINELLTRT
jgi:hypothetical protein